MNEPLAYKLRPNKLDEVIGQKHLIGTDKVLTNLVNNKRLFSIILYGKPGIGKTSIANALANELDMKVRFLNATINNKHDFDVVFAEAKLYNGLILVVDEIHRLNKDKQDLLLPLLENGLVTLIGLTTSNPFHSINPAIRSRTQIFELKELTKEDIVEGINHAIKTEYLENIEINKDTINYIANLAAGDLRTAYNLLETAYYSAPNKNITLEVIKNINNKANFFHDKNGDGHYDIISALQKSIRGSDVNAALHYLARLVLAEDLEIILRRLSVITYEDIGLANPSMGPKLDAVINACERLGFPEARIPLAVLVIDLCLSPKSNSAYKALDLAINEVNKGKAGPIPNNIKSSSENYLYPHDYPYHYVNQPYLPSEIKDDLYYIPASNKYELSLKKYLDFIEKLKKQ